jgi:hypothetical protein
VFALRYVKRDVSPFQQRLRVDGMLRSCRNADARAERDGDTLDDDRFLDDQQQLLCELFDLLHMLDAPHDGEFIAAQTCDVPVLHDEITQADAQFAHELIAHAVAERVIHLFEAVQIQHHQRDDLLRAPFRQCVFQLLGQGHAIGQSGECVMKGEVT